tara:strand:- start:1687 stop:1854 length:168 start_codon:yes stop_codon:yes gene_type:complete
VIRSLGTVALLGGGGAFKTGTCRFLRLECPSDADRASGVLDIPGTAHVPDWIDRE